MFYPDHHSGADVPWNQNYFCKCKPKPACHPPSAPAREAFLHYPSHRMDWVLRSMYFRYLMTGKHSGSFVWDRSEERRVGKVWIRGGAAWASRRDRNAGGKQRKVEARDRQAARSA